VNLAVNAILPERPTLLVSGINRGANLGDDVTYSGTVSACDGGNAARHSVDRDVARRPWPLRLRSGRTFRGAADGVGARARVAARHAPQRECPAGQGRRRAERGRADAHGRRRYGDAIVEKVDPRGRKYYWIAGDEVPFVAEEGTDFHAVQHGRISVTPIHLDLTNYPTLEQLAPLRATWP
jgi:5'-nucleotidase